MIGSKDCYVKNQLRIDGNPTDFHLRVSEAGKVSAAMSVKVHDVHQKRILANQAMATVQVKTDIQYPNATINPNASDGEKLTSSVFISMNDVRLKFFKWAQRLSTPFTHDDINAFENPARLEKLDDLEKDNIKIKTVQHTTYDRSFRGHRNPCDCY